MKKAIVLIALIMIAKPVLPVLDYIINYNYIATQLCENKARPQLHCNGKCHLAKQLAKAADSEKPSQNKKIPHESEVLFLDIPASCNFPHCVAIITKRVFPEYINCYSHSGNGTVFRPPVFIS